MSTLKHDGRRLRYVNDAEKAAQSLARQQLWELAYETFVKEQVPLRPRESPFRAYHANCPLRECAIAAGSAALDRNRVAIITRARLHVYLTRL